MSNKKISQLDEATNVAFNDLLQVIDVSDSSMSIAGTNKKITAQTFGSNLPVVATGSSASRSLKDRFEDTVNAKDFGAVGDGVTDSEPAINAALAYAASIGGSTVIVPQGTYNLGATLKIGANTALLSNSATRFVRKHTGTFLSNDLGITSTITNYEGNGNIVINGGIWDGNSTEFYDGFVHFSIGQADNIKITNCTFLDNIRAHAVDLSACRNVWIENNKFLGYSKLKHSPDGYGTSSDDLGEAISVVTFNPSTSSITGPTIPVNGESVQFSVISGTTGISINTWYFVVNSSDSTFQVSPTFNGTPVILSGTGTGELKTWIRNYSEAVQLDHNVEGSFSFGALNGTPCINIFFKGNVIGPNPARNDNTFKSWGVGIGSHGAVNNRFMQNIVVEGNTFTDCGFAGVRAWKWVALTVDSNVFRGCVRGVHVTPTAYNQASAKNPDGSDSGQGQTGYDYTITGNVFESYSDIGVFFVNPGAFNTGEAPFYHRRVTITGNTFSNGVTNSAIEARWIDGLTVTGNVFSNIFRGFEAAYCRNVVISNNTLKDAAREFAYWSDYVPASGLAGASQNIIISNNQMTNLGYSAINIEAASNFGISGNLIIGPSTFASTRYGIVCSTKASNGLISSNTVLDGGASFKPAYSIYVTETCSNVSLGANKVFAGITGDVYNGSRDQLTLLSNAGRVVQGMTTIDSMGQGETSKPGLFIKGFNNTEGEIAVPLDEALNFGQYDESTGEFTDAARINRDLNLRIVGAGKGVELLTPDESKVYRITVSNSGAVTSTLI